jgi:hypothetical protein
VSRYEECPACGAVQWGNATCGTCRPHWEGGDPVPISEEEEAYGRAYWEVLAYGEAEPDGSGLDPARLAVIRGALDREWRARVRRITRRT